MFLERYKSKVVPRPTSNKKFIIFPTPKYLSIKKSVAVEAIIKPLLEFARREENVKRRVTKNIKKNKGTIPGVVGLTKQSIAAMANQEIQVMIRVGKKFFLFLIFFFLPSTAWAVRCLLADFFLMVIFYPIWLKFS